MLDKLALIEERYEELNTLMADPAAVADHNLMRTYAQEQSEIEDIVQRYRQYRANAEQLDETRAMLDDALEGEMLELVEEEIRNLEAQQEALHDELKRMLLPRDPNDEKNVIMEIRAGAGGDEAGLFGADLYRMYSRYAENHGWSTDVLNAHRTGVGGFKEVIFEIKGRGAYSRLKYESGVHRVQRVPITEASGRIHTSTSTVAVLPEIDDVEIRIAPDDIQMEVYRSSGPGGQHMQKNSTAVRLTYLPTGMVVTCESERSQVQNRERAMAILRARLYQMEEAKRLAERGEDRRSQVGTGERSEKIRTYNFPQNRVTDHRIGLSVYRLESVLDGDLDEFIDELATTEQAERLQVAGVD